MKSYRFLIILVLFGSLIQLSGCKHEKPKIGILIHSYENARWAKDKDYL